MSEMMGEGWGRESKEGQKMYKAKSAEKQVWFGGGGEGGGRV